MQAQMHATAQREYNHAKESLNRAMYEAFRKLWPGSSGDRIVVELGRSRLEGRAVILRNGTKLGLYVDIGGNRTPVPEPYSETARILKRK